MPDCGVHYLKFAISAALVCLFFQSISFNLIRSHPPPPPNTHAVCVHQLWIFSCFTLAIICAQELPGGMLMNPDGTMMTADGQIIVGQNPDGTFITADGRVIGADGQEIFEPEPEIEEDIIYEGPLCDMCLEQPAQFRCMHPPCNGDLLCVWCDANQHRFGPRKGHTRTALAAPCECCGAREAQVIGGAEGGRAGRSENKSNPRKAVLVQAGGAGGAGGLAQGFGVGGGGGGVEKWDCKAGPRACGLTWWPLC